MVVTAILVYFYCLVKKCFERKNWKRMVKGLPLV